MIGTLLVANRGEIARRVLRTASAMGIRTVAVFTPPDAHAPFVRAADRALPLDDYLDIDAVVRAARESGADGVHPGYGFLSENPAFAEACRDAGIVFVGPAPEAMRALGNKERAREAAVKAGVPVVPGAADGGDLRRAAETLGYPLLVKAADGGGGKGMRLVAGPSELDPALEAARREAEAAFGSDRVILERLVSPARHVEVQILGDAHGGLWHFGERECSLQRRHQKVVEECPSPSVDPALRGRLGDAALRIARSAGYTGAGTVEFLLDDRGGFYFLEVNARLQVEHPVTELTYGVDLVALQLRVAAGEALVLDPALLVPRGHAIEARVYAEDPARGFLPAPGPVLLYREPSGPGIRVDSGIEDGYEIPDRYDPILLKVIAHAEDREAARRRLSGALRETVLLGTVTNLEYLAAILDHPAFAAGEFHTRFLDERFLDWKPAAPDPAALALAARVLESPNGGGPGGAPDPERWSPWRTLEGWGRT